MSCITRPLINVKIKYENAKMKLKLFQRCNNNFYTTYEKYHYTLAILNRRRSASDWGSSPDWIPVFTGMTHPLPSSTDCPLVILNRRRSASDWGSIPSRHPALDAGSIQTGFPFSRE